MKTFARKEQHEHEIMLPDSWAQAVRETLQEVYHQECLQKGLVFDVLGATFPNELIIGITLIHPHQLTSAPYTFLISADLNDGNAADKMLKTLIDQSAHFFDLLFKSEDPDELYEANWSEAEGSPVPFYYKVSRENLRLTLEANKILGDD